MATFGEAMDTLETCEKSLLALRDLVGCNKGPQAEQFVKQGVKYFHHLEGRCKPCFHFVKGKCNQGLNCERCHFCSKQRKRSYDKWFSKFGPQKLEELKRELQD